MFYIMHRSCRLAADYRSRFLLQLANASVPGADKRIHCSLNSSRGARS